MVMVSTQMIRLKVSSKRMRSTSTTSAASGATTAGSVSNDLYCMATLDACRQILARLQPLRHDLLGHALT